MHVRRPVRAEDAGRSSRPGARWVTVVAVATLLLAACGGGAQEVPYSELKHRIEAGEVASVSVSAYSIEAVPTDSARAAGAPAAWVAVPLPNDDGLVELLDAQGVAYAGRAAEGPSPFLILGFLLVGGLVLGGTLHFQQRAARSATGAGALRIRDARAEERTVDFGDVAGADEAKEELVEVVEFLRNPERFARLGARIPKGVLLVGPPGTGKTLLARAVAGEAEVPFFSISGSEFVEMFVGVGASRVRKLFERAKAKAPCIVFIDELDAVGKSRGGARLAGNDEREQTLNQLLVEMDGFESSKGIVLIGATNRPEILDQALLRPGRFDRQVLVDRPDRSGREAILHVHARGLRLAGDVDLGAVAERTPGFVGADLANLLNEAALLAARRDRSVIGMDEIDAAVDRVMIGLEKKSRLIHAKERRIVAYHEGGHALVAETVEAAEPVKKVSIIPRGLGALGYMQQIPEERNLLQHDELLDRLAVLLGGRAAEQIIFGQVSTGAANDLERATELARRMVCEFGMSKVLGPVAYARSGPAFLHAPGSGSEEPRPFSEETARAVDQEVLALVSGAFERAREILERRRGALEAVAEHLLVYEVMDREELLAILGEAA